MKDYYSILGIERNSSIEDIKIAYKKLAMKYHPDRNQDDNAEENFKNINEAYMILSCPNKKLEYDNKLKYGDNSGTDYNNQYDYGHYQNSYYQNFNNYSYEDNSYEEYNINMDISLEESQIGVKKRTDIPIIITCDFCRGLKFDPYKGTFKCFKCEGRGYEINGDSFFVFQKTCYYCNGKGYFSKNNCSKCNGVGTLNINESVEIEIPKYSESGDKILVNNVISGFNGKILVNIFIKKHQSLIKKGNNLHVYCDIFFTDYLLGKSFFVKTLFDEVLKIKFPYSNTKIYCLKGFGLVSKDGNCGCLYIHINITFPKNINLEQKKILVLLDKAFN